MQVEFWNAVTTIGSLLANEGQGTAAENRAWE